MYFVCTYFLKNLFQIYQKLHVFNFKANRLTEEAKIINGIHQWNDIITASECQQNNLDISDALYSCKAVISTKEIDICDAIFTPKQTPKPVVFALQNNDVM